MRPRSLATFLAFGVTSPALAAETFEGMAYYAGDMHVHTGASGDGGAIDVGSCSGTCGALANLAYEAKENGLDFIVVTDHVNGPFTAEPEDFEQVWDAVLAAHLPLEGLVTVPGAELAFTSGGNTELGHRTLALFGTDQDLGLLTMKDLQPNGDDSSQIDGCPAIWEWAEALEAKAGPLMVFPHHPGARVPMATNWTCNHPYWAPIVEVYSQHGSSDRADTTYDPVSVIEPHGMVEHALDPFGQGQVLGFVAGTDSHDTHPGSVCDLDGERTALEYGGGLTIAVIDETTPFDRGALYQALSKRSTYATSGPQIPVVVDYSSGGVRIAGMGEVGTLSTDPFIEVEVRVAPTAADTVDEIVLRGPNGLEIPITKVGPNVWNEKVPAAVVGAYLAPELLIDGVAYYGEFGCADGGDTTERLWVSPTWFVSPEPDVTDTDSEEQDTAVTDTADDAEEGVLIEVEYSGLVADEDETPAADGDSPLVPQGCGGGRAVVLLPLSVLARRRSAR